MECNHTMDIIQWCDEDNNVKGSDRDCCNVKAPDIQKPGGSVPELEVCTTLALERFLVGTDGLNLRLFALMGT